MRRAPGARCAPGLLLALAGCLPSHDAKRYEGHPADAGWEELGRIGISKGLDEIYTVTPPQGRAWRALRLRAYDREVDMTALSYWLPDKHQVEVRVPNYLREGQVLTERLPASSRVLRVDVTARVRGLGGAAVLVVLGQPAPAPGSRAEEWPAPQSER